MGYEALTQPAVQEYIQEHEREDLAKFCLKKSPFTAVSSAEMAQQIAGRRIAEKKFPSLYTFPLLYPPKINLEQTSSEATARYKAGLVHGKTFCDLTAGFGIDSYFISENFEETSLVEKDSELLKIVQYNWETVGKSAQFYYENLQDFLPKIAEPYNLVFLDPARRDASKRKVFLLEDLSPNILEIQEKLFQSAKKIMIKLSPLIDLHYLKTVLPNITSIHVVAVRNEVKEILVLLEPNTTAESDTLSVNLESAEPIFQLPFSQRNSAEPEYSSVQTFLFIPNVSVLKAGLINNLAVKFCLKKLHPNTQLLTGNENISDFPGRVMPVEKISASEIKKGAQANLIAKNYPLTPEEIRKKYKTKDGGENYLIFCRSVGGLEILRSL